MAKFNSLISTVVPTFPPNVLNTLESTIIPIATNVTPSYTVTSTYTVTPILTPFPTVQPFGGGVLVFATGDLGKQDLYSIRGNGLDLTRLTPESGYIGYRWSGCDCSGVKRISGYDYVMGLSPDQKFLYYYYAPLGERKLRVINMFTLETIIDVFAPYGSALAWSQDGDKVAYTEYVEKDIEYIKVVDSHGQNPIEVGEGHRIDNIGWTQDGHSLFYTDHICLNGSITYNVDAYEYPVCDNYLHVADPAVQGDKVVYSILLHSGIFFEVSAVASNTAPQIAIPTPNKVVIFDYLSHQEIRSVSYPAVLQGYDILKQPYWSEDGTLLFRVNNPYTKNKEIYELLNGEFSILTDEERFQASNILEPLSREYSPLIYIGRNNNEQEVYIRDVNALNPPEVIGQVISIKEIVQNLGMSGFEFSKVSWSPDRNELALILSRDEEQSTILIYSLLNRKVRKLIDNIEDYSSVSWSPDGNYLAFISKPVRSSSPALYIVDHSGENIVKLADTSQKDLGGLFWVPSH